MIKVDTSCSRNLDQNTTSVWINELR